MRARFKPGGLLVGGHRGNPAEHPENTLASFRSALDLGLRLIECDVHLTLDRGLAVIHDFTIDRTTDGQGPVGLRTLAQLRRYDAGGGERIPSLDEVLELAAEYGAGVAIELKIPPRGYPGIEEALVIALRRQRMVGDCAVISFDHDTIRRVKDLEPELTTGALVTQPAADPAALLAETGAEIYSPHWSMVDLGAVTAVHREGKAVGVWTVDDADTLGRVTRLGVDAVYTNSPREILAALSTPDAQRPPV